MHIVFYSIPYTDMPEIGGLVYVSGPEMSDLGQKVSPLGAKSVIFRDFLVIFGKNSGFHGPESVYSGQTGKKCQNQPF